MESIVGVEGRALLFGVGGGRRRRDTMEDAAIGTRWRTPPSGREGGRRDARETPPSGREGGRRDTEREMCLWAISKYFGDLVSNTSA
jgi:hypothetical protein